MTVRMRKMLMIFYGIAGASSAILALLCAFASYETAQLPYNSEGRYYDGIVVHHDTAPFGWALFAVFAIAASVAFWWAAWRVRERTRGEAARRPTRTLERIMNRGPYAPPKSEVRDVLPVPVKCWIRTKWWYLFLSGFLAFVIFMARETLLPAFTPVTVTFGLTLGILISAWPIQTIAARRSRSSTWWWEVLFLCVAGIAIIGAALDEPVMVGTGFLSAITYVGAVALVTWIIEARYQVRAYSKARGVVFVTRNDAL